MPTWIIFMPEINWLGTLVTSIASWALKNWCFWTVVLEKTLERPLDCKEIQPVHPKGDQFLNVHWKDWCWSWNSNPLATWCEELTHLKRPWCWERLKARGEGDDRGWDGWMASVTQWTWVWVNSRSWWWTGRPGVLQSMGSQGVGHDWATGLNWTSSFPATPMSVWTSCEQESWDKTFLCLCILFCKMEMLIIVLSHRDCLDSSR